jgi:hypothetical protein
MNDRWNSLNIDVLICPHYHHSAFKHENHYLLDGLLDYQCVWSVFQNPCGTIPVTRVKDNETTGYVDQYNDDITKVIRDDMLGSEGLPLAV